MNKPLYEFGPFRLDQAERRLTREGQPVPLTPKCFDLLVVLVENSGHLLEKEELLSRVWPNQFVEESNLSFNVSALRKALGEGPNGSQYIETVPKRGYRFVAQVECRGDGMSYGGLPAEKREEDGKEPAEHAAKVGRSVLSVRPRLSWRFIILSIMMVVGSLGLIAYALWRSPSPVQQPLRTIAVLPFKPLTADSRNESLEMGMAGTLITSLGSFRQIVVRPMSAVRKYTDPQQDPVQAGRELNVEAVLDGSIQKVDERVRVTVRLVDVQTGATLWAEQFDTHFTDILEVQDSISERVTQGLMFSLSGRQREQLTKHHTENLEAYQLYLQGHYLFGKHTGNRDDNLRKSLEYYQLAVEKDPNFAPAYVGIAEFYISAGDPKLTPGERSLKAKAAVEKALALDDTLAEAHNALAELKYQYEFDWSAAEEGFKRAIELEPNVAYFRLAHSWYQMCRGRFDEAQSELNKAQELEPGSLRINKTQGILFLFMRQYDKAISHYQKMREVEPTLIHRNQWSMSVAYEQMGMHAEAVEEFLEDSRMRGYLMPDETKALGEALRRWGWQAYVRMRIKLLEEKSKKEYIPPTILAGVYSLAGKKDPAFAWLEQAIDTRDPWLSLMKIQPAYDNLRDDPRFARLIQRLNLMP